ncbi:MAG: hypothetical protein OXU67_05130 [Chloroflexota bacterium]|nr:hypothetical protein [Chloroflexota bacterium]
MGANVHAPATATGLVDRLVAALPMATWHYNAAIGEMNVVLPGGEGRSAHIPWLHVDEEWDFYVRMDAATGQPLSLVIYPFDVWLAEQEGQPLSPPEAPIDYAAARRHVERALRTSTTLATDWSNAVADGLPVPRQFG